MANRWLASHGRWIWRIRSLFLSGIFYASRFYLTRKEQAREEMFASRALRALVRVTFLQVLLAVLTVALLLWSDSYLANSYVVLGWPKPEKVDDGLYGTMLGAIASIGGVFIGLYFAALTSIAAAAYARFPSSVRNLLTAERVGGVYIRSLAYITCVALLLLVLRVLKYPPMLVAMPTMAIFSCFGVVAFVKLGQRVFSFFDPVQVSDYAQFQMIESLRSAQAGGFKCFDPPFQLHAHRRAAQAIDAIVTLADICFRETHLQKRSLLLLSNWIASFLLEYQEAKKRIPTESHWYERIGEFRDIYRTDDMAVQMAHQTGTLPSGTLASDQWWIEDRLFPVLLDTLSFSLKHNDGDSAIDAASHIERMANGLARVGDITKALDVLEKTTAVYLVALDAIKEESLADDSLRLHLATAQAIIRMPISVLLSARLFAVDLGEETFATALYMADWKKRDAPYGLGIPRVALPTAEDLQGRLAFELEVEGRLITPTWYIKELLFCSMSGHYRDALVALIVDIPKKTFEAIEVHTAKTKLLWTRALLLSSQLEYESKALVHFETFLDTWRRLVGEKRIEGLEWAKLDEPALRATLATRQQRLVRSFPILSVALQQQPRPKSVPDFGGLFLHESGEAIFDALVRGNQDLFSTLFEPYFYGCLLAFERLRPAHDSLPEHLLPGAIGVSIAPIADLLDISGYAYLFSELRSDASYWTAAKIVWDAYFSEKTEAGKARLSQLGAILELLTDPVRPAGRSMLRMQWQMVMSQTIRGFLGIEDYRSYGHGYEERVDHPSPLVRIVARDRLVVHYDGVDIFSDFYFSDFGAPVKGRRPWKDLKEMVSREAERHAHQVQEE